MKNEIENLFDDVSSLSEEEETTNIQNDNNSDNIDSYLQQSEIKDELKLLGVGLVDQTTLERKIMAEADKAITEREEALDQKRLDKARSQAIKAQNLLTSLKSKLKNKNATTIEKDQLNKKINEQVTILRNARRDEADIIQRITEREESKTTNKDGIDMNKRQNNETQKDYLIRTGKITPFTNMNEVPTEVDDNSNIIIPGTGGNYMPYNNNIKRSTTIINTSILQKEDEKDIESSWKELHQKSDNEMDEDDQSLNDSDDANYDDDQKGKDDYNDKDDESDYKEEVEEEGGMEVDDGDDEDYEDLKELEPKKNKHVEQIFEDDGNEATYENRLRDWIYNRRLIQDQQKLKNVNLDELNEDIEIDHTDIDTEIYEPHPLYHDHYIDKLRVPGEIWKELFDYQKTCLQWLYELHNQKVGGIIGDEMGLGKTIQIISFLSSLYYSKILGPGVPSIVVCPATVLKQWVEEFHKWWPPLRVAILHSSGSGIRYNTSSSSTSGDKNHSDFNIDDVELYDSVDDEEYEPDRRGKSSKKKKSRGKSSLLFTKTGKKAAAVVDRFIKKGGILITTYSGLQTYREILLKHKWGYIILDEGHKIRNPDSETTLACKQFKTSHRIILSGTPIQNNLKELWSLFDFIFPGRLGTLPVFQSQFSIPINIGGYANASNVQVQTAYKCACMLRDLINPYLLRRMKVDVATDLPKKSEQVLFCKLTPSQRQAYLQFINSKDMDSILERRRQVLFGIDIVRKICNHPDLVDLATSKKNSLFGDPEKSGKMVVVRALLKLWQKKHRVLLFCQTRQMLDILEKMISQLGYQYRRLDGTTPVHHRMVLVHEFNSNTDIDVFLLTTKVGGLGLNLIGADRVILFDPDWNPSTDMQARERAWRLGQKKDVSIYRLMTSGTIEEKIYHRQIYKQFLTNKILKDPKQRRFFDASNLKSLFTLTTEDTTSTETGKIFEGSEIKLKLKKKRKRDEDQQKIQDLVGVSNIESFKNKNEENNIKEKHHGDDNILSSLFEMTGIQSALKHDHIMEASSKDTFFVEREATMIAERAAAVLKESRKRTRLNDIGTPTWTGRSGIAGSPRQSMSLSSSTPRFGQKLKTPMATTNSEPISSSSPSSSINNKNVFGKGLIAGLKGSGPLSSNVLLAQMKQRKEMEKNNGYLLSTTTSSIKFEDEKEKWIEKIRDYIANNGGRAESKDIMNSLQIDIKQEDIVVFRKMIQAIAKFEKSEQGKGVWILKNEYL